eukprot:CAMPEP_0195587026 /NCGR_PEP_ID=MMETSP0814-20130614/30290_1 /TAXON_ID=97485 /ORGANISM="Prymnesium parvum, Strain Texoma1" /LENGTH=147 /DNA_ID=CAMNT_0040725697 /DNA_START=336 /DNA_END=779 /DNA_ORIENTATION=-
MGWSDALIKPFMHHELPIQVRCLFILEKLASTSKVDAPVHQKLIMHERDTSARGEAEGLRPATVDLYGATSLPANVDDALVKLVILLRHFDYLLETRVEVCEDLALHVDGHPQQLIEKALHRFDFLVDARAHTCTLGVLEVFGPVCL